MPRSRRARRALGGGAGRGDDFGGAETREVLDDFFVGADISARY